MKRAWEMLGPTYRYRKSTSPLAFVFSFVVFCVHISEINYLEYPGQCNSVLYVLTFTWLPSKRLFNHIHKRF
jgi:hypothetical protein